MKVKFLVRDSRVGKDGTSPIELSIIINNERKVITLDRRCNPSKWDSRIQKVKGSKDLNDYINLVRSQCYALHSEMVSLKLHITAETFIYAYKNGIKKNIITIEHAFNETIRVKGNLSKCTIGKYKVTLAYLKEFLLKEYGYVDVLVGDITPNTCQLFFNYLLTQVSNNTAIYRLKHLYTVLLYCRNEGYIQCNPCKVKFKKDKLDYHPLTKEQLHILKTKKIENKRLNNVRDMFILQCHTGLAYADLATLTKDDIKGDVIIKNRCKTNIQSVIPILNVTKEILEKYDYQLPVLSNQKYNSYLKEIGDICGITQELHTHLARHTMATICINNGVDINIIAKILGHTTTRTTLSIYAHLQDDTVAKEKDKLNDIFQ